MAVSNVNPASSDASRCSWIPLVCGFLLINVILYVKRKLRIILPSVVMEWIWQYPTFWSRLRFLQIWIKPEKHGLKPNYGSRVFKWVQALACNVNFSVSFCVIVEIYLFRPKCILMRPLPRLGLPGKQTDTTRFSMFWQISRDMRVRRILARVSSPSTKTATCMFRRLIQVWNKASYSPRDGKPMWFALRVNCLWATPCIWTLGTLWRYVSGLWFQSHNFDLIEIHAERCPSNNHRNVAVSFHICTEL